MLQPSGLQRFRGGYTGGSGSRCAGWLWIVVGGILCASACAQSDDTIVFEAESANRIDAIFERCTDTACSGRAVLEVRESRGNDYGTDEDRTLHEIFPHVGFSTTQGTAEYRFRVDRGGQYTLWARAYWFDSCGNSIWVVMPETPAYTFGQDETYSRWHWVKAEVPLQLSRGVFSLRIRNREDGVRIDQFCITQDKDFRPRGIMKPNARFAFTEGITMSVTTVVPVVLAGKSTRGSVWVRNNWQSPRTVALAAEADATLEVQLTGKTRWQLPANIGLAEIPFAVKTVKHQPLKRSRVRFTASWDGGEITKSICFQHFPAWEVAGPFTTRFGWRSPASSPANRIPVNMRSQKWLAVLDQKDLRPSGRINFLRFFPNRKSCWALARTEFDWDAEETVYLALRSDDQSILWANGELVAAHNVKGPSDRYHTIAAVPLKRGKNTLLLVVKQIQRFWDGGVELQ